MCAIRLISGNLRDRKLIHEVRRILLQARMKWCRPNKVMMRKPGGNHDIDDEDDLDDDLNAYDDDIDESMRSRRTSMKLTSRMTCRCFRGTRVDDD